MSTRHLTQDDLVLHYYGELAGSDEAGAATHLKACQTCRGEFTRLQRVLGAVDETSIGRVDLPANFEPTVWARLEPNLRRERRGWGSWMTSILSPAPLALAATVLLLSGAAFFAGRVSSPGGAGGSGSQAGRTEQVRERILLVDLGDHLDRSQMVLVELVSVENGADGTSVDISRERERAEQLVAANRLYRKTAAETGDTAVADLLDELERVLVDVAASPEQLTGMQLEDVRRRIESRSLLFKVRVVSSEVKDRQIEAIRERTGQRSSSAGT